MKSLFVGNLSFDATQDELRILFEEFGEVTRVHIPASAEHPGQGRGFAFVEMPNDEAAAAATQALDESEFMGRNLRINEAKPREERGGRGAPRGGRGRGGRGRGGR